MATRSTATAGRVARHDDFGPPFPHRPQPGSPTLTNPDMILPDYNELEPLQHYPQSPSDMWNDTQPLDAFHDFSSAYMSGPLGPNTPIIYGNGTMLSDIGEVTEVESTVGYEMNRNSSRLSGADTGTESSDALLRTSSIVGKKMLRKRPQITNRERRLSIESTSTIQTTEVLDGVFGDFDDSVSVDDSSFQGDDEESNASEFVYEKAVQMRSFNTLPSGQAPNEDSLSASSISKRAEQILANAKRRLTAMEGNLNRARTFSYSSVSDGSTPSPSGSRSNALPKARINSVLSSHSRNVSDNGLHGALRINMLPQRSASALGAAGGYRQQLPLSRSADALGVKSSLGSLRSPLPSIDSALEPLEENEAAEDETQSRPNHRLQSRGSPSVRSFADAGMTRSASAAQMRDLQDQMQDLKGKISSLRDKAKQDSMKRRSMQNLRALSPFTNAGYDPELTSTKPAASPESDSPPSGHAINSMAPTRVNGRSENRGEREQQPRVENQEQADSTKDWKHGAYGAQSPELRNGSPVSMMSDPPEEQRRSNDERLHAREVYTISQPDDEEGQDVGEDTCSESGESLYHDTHQEPGDISHEDREDAFDYEHFFLHSAMGTLSRQGMARTGSFSSECSEDSVETTRGPTLTNARRPSLDTLNSVDSFATAQEDAVESRSSTAQSSRLGDGFATPRLQNGGDGPSRTRRSSLGCFIHHNGGGGGGGSESRPYVQNHVRHSSLVHRPVTSGTDTALHRPSVSSFESIGTNRSFPLVNKTRLSGGLLTPGGSPDHKLKQVAESIMNETASIRDKDSASSGPSSPAIQTLSREDQLLVEQVVASLGRCVLGLSESTRQGTGNHELYRRRIEAARKLLENVSD